ncbi:tol-pal system YbgF family protein [Treponema sp. Marseille-Q4523]|uniref:tetratricopeptide repeat protein n=1 Tax=Treponema sp. Marseille-Q4523 TaxID=2810610 RepID=UPI001961F25B|nr:tetratricopeptide repeat protein [Treponema sp. Marseille-Q4523]MBM7022132.1 tetratricopeptide repeat protein [Treponema sp. Marseille-Q4523]
MIEKKFEKATAGERLSQFMMRHRMQIIVSAAVVIGAIVVYGISAAVVSSSTTKGISFVDTVEYDLTNDSDPLSDAEIETRRSDAMTKLTPYLTRGGIVGVRANMLAAGIAYGRKDYAAAKAYWTAAAAKGAKSYTAPLAYYNIAVCDENTGNLSDAAASYGKAADVKDFPLASHARFSEARTYETLGDYKKAAEAYAKLTAGALGDAWTNLAETRLIALKAEGKTE